MSRGASATPKRDSEARCTAFEIEIEVCWTRLVSMPYYGQRTVCLSPKTGLLVTRWPREEAYPGEVGTFTRAIGLQDFRDACFAAKEQGR